jgi:two-component system, LytTR family, sensor kinase
MLPSGQKQLWVRLSLLFGIWTAVALVLTGQAYLVVYSAQQAQSDLAKLQPTLALTELLLSHLVECLLWALLSIGIFWLARRFPLGPGTWLRSMPVHVAGCLIFGVVHTVLSVVAAEVIREEIPRPTITPNVLLYYFVAHLNSDIFIYWAILAVSHVLNYYRQLRDRELRSSQLEAKLAQTQLQILKMQLHPHFLFNTLNAISALIHQDVELADRMIARLGDLLRSTLENANQQEVAFRQELDFIDPYLEIEKARLGPRLTVRLDVDPAAMEARVPNLILQPLVENAIRHGIAPRPEPGRIEISARRENGFLRLAVKDDGRGLEAATPSASGIGLANTRARLEKLYGANHRFELTNIPDGGLHVEIAIPFRADEPAVVEAP